MMIIPYSTEVLIEKRPISNILIISACFLMFWLMLNDVFAEETLSAMVLSGWNPIGLLTHQFMHAGILHIAFNMLYLWVFGNTVCAKVGNLTYVAVFLLCGALAAVVHNLLSGTTAIGASGAVNGIVGFYLVLHPINRVSCFWFFPMFFIVRWGTFEAAGFWLLIAWFIIDAFMAVTGIGSGVAYWGHVGGFLSGVMLGVLFLKTGSVTMSPYDNPNLLDYFKASPDGRNTVPAGARIGNTVSSSNLKSRATLNRTESADDDETATILKNCPHCNQIVKFPAERKGQEAACIKCGGTFLID